MNAADRLVATLRLPGIAYAFSRLGYRSHARQFVHAAALRPSMAERTCVITGANSGIGLACAEQLALMGSHLVLLCRDRERGEAAACRLRGRGGGSVRVECVDMADLASIRALLASGAIPEAVDVLVHNAGALFHERQRTKQGLKRTLALHVAGPEHLTRGLLASLQRAGPDSRVIYVSSGGMYAERLSVERLLHPPDPFDGVRAYAQAKRAQVVLADLWAARHADVSFYAMHPGWVDTGGVRSALPRFYSVTKHWLRTPAEGADTIVWLAAAHRLPLASGLFVFDRQAAERHIVPGTQEESAERHRLLSALDAILSAGG